MIVVSDADIDRMEKMYTRVIPGVMDSLELEDMRQLIFSLRESRKNNRDISDENKILRRERDRAEKKVEELTAVVRDLTPADPKQGDDN